jgi:hypothetical protein
MGKRSEAVRSVDNVVRLHVYDRLGFDQDQNSYPKTKQNALAALGRTRLHFTSLKIMSIQCSLIDLDILFSVDGNSVR